MIVRSVTLDALKKEISIDTLTARNIIQQIQQKYNRKYFIIVNVGKNMLIALPFSVRLFQLVFSGNFLLSFILHKCIIFVSKMLKHNTLYNKLIYS